LTKQKAISLLNETKKYPNMFASTKEAFIMRVATILEMVLPKFNILEFYKKHIIFYNNIFLDLNEEFSVSWAENVIFNALEMLNNYD
jgi:hypothetical protein